MSDTNMLNIFDRVTSKIISDLERGVRPWQKPWQDRASRSPVLRPNRHNGEPYNGVNILLLWDAAMERGYQNPTWMTYKQAEDYGAHVRRGEKASWIVYANKVTRTEVNEATGQETEKQIPFMRGYTVFNAEQIEGLPEKFFLSPAAPDGGRLEKVDRFIKNTGAVIRTGGDRAYYSEINDYIQMPFSDQFRDSVSYYATLAHESCHWTKHESRLNREFGRMFWGDEGYAKEELVAEMGAAFLCADLGITLETREDHAAYMETWLQALKNEKKLIFSAAAHATRAVHYLKSLQPEITLTTQADNNIPSRTQTLYISKPLEIGRHLWRLLIERAGRGLRTRYEFKDQNGSSWHESINWRSIENPTLSSSLPPGLAKLLEREQPTLRLYGLGTGLLLTKQLDLCL